jgi:hypothetical protein
MTINNKKLLVALADCRLKVRRQKRSHLAFGCFAHCSDLSTMVRGHAKAVSQEKRAAKDADKAKSAKRDSSEVILFFSFLRFLIFHSD